MIRITGGEFRGRKIKSPHGLSSRPTLEKVREALFDILGNHLEKIRFLDLYAGVGLVGLEAISRGAEHAIFVERELRLVRVLRENIKLLQVQRKAKIFHGSVSSLVLRLTKNPPEIIFLDPPYGSEEAGIILTKLGYSDPMPNTRVIVQHHYKDRIPETVGNLTQTRQKRYGETLLSFFRFQN